MIEIRTSPVHGKGVFATEDLKEGTLLYCDVLLIDRIDLSGSLEMYYYPWDAKNRCVCCGFGSFFNSSIRPNCRIDSLDKENLKKVFRITSFIGKGEEIFLKYNL